MVKSAVDGTRRVLVSAVLVGMLAGCAVGPDFRRPEPPAASTYLPGAQPSGTVAAKGPGGTKQRFEPGSDIPSEWWSLFRSESLDRRSASRWRRTRRWRKPAQDLCRHGRISMPGPAPRDIPRWMPGYRPHAGR